MYRRNLTPGLREALGDTPVVFLHGARQSGKTTLVRALGEETRARYLTLDDVGVLSAAREDPQGFLAGLEDPVILDEVQRAPGLLLAIKGEVDRNRAPGRFLLTGSANILLLPRLSETLVGRMEILTLWPLAQDEIGGTTGSLVDRLFDERFHPEPASRKRPHADLLARIVRGGFPEAVSRKNPERRDRWFESYLLTILQRDVRDLSNVDGLTELPRLLSILAARTSTLRNFSEISRYAGIPQSTLKRYFSLLQTSFLVQVLHAWSGNLGKRLVKSPKMMLVDSGVLCHLLGVTEDRLIADRALLGHVLENFVAMEILKQISWSAPRPKMYHFRSHTGDEVDLVLEDTRGRIVGIEVKASESIGSDDFKGLRVLADLTGRGFLRGVVLYRGAESIPFGANLHTLPISTLWSSKDATH